MVDCPSSSLVKPFSNHVTNHNPGSYLKHYLFTFVCGNSLITLLISQLHYYQNVKCRQEMYDRDIQLIQSVAALMDPNSFLIHLLNKFKVAPVFQ